MGKNTQTSYKFDITIMKKFAENIDATTVLDFTESGTKVDQIISSHSEIYTEQDGRTAFTDYSEVDGPSTMISGNLPKKIFRQKAKLQDRKAPSFKTITKWVGEVIDVFEDSFTARVYEIKKQDNTSDAFDDYVDFLNAEVNPSDREFIEKGAIFDWCIGQKFKPHGQMENTSVVIFRRMPVWKNYLQKAEEKSKEFMNIMGWSDNTLDVSSRK